MGSSKPATDWVLFRLVLAGAVGWAFLLVIFADWEDYLVYRQFQLDGGRFTRHELSRIFSRMDAGELQRFLPGRGLIFVWGWVALFHLCIALRARVRGALAWVLAAIGAAAILWGGHVTLSAVPSVEDQSVPNLYPPILWTTGVYSVATAGLLLLRRLAPGGDEADSRP